MATVTHKFVSPLADGPNEDQVQPSNWNDTHNVTINWGDLEGILSDQTDLQSALNDKLEEINWGDIGGTLSDQTDLQNALDAKADAISALPSGGTTGQLLAKATNDDFDVEWTNGASSPAWGDITGTLSDQTDLQNSLNTKLEEVNWGDITGTLSDQTDLQNALDAKLGVAGGTVTGPVVFERSADNTLVIRDTRNTDNTVVSPLRFEGGNGSGNDITFRFVLDGANGIKRYDVNFTSGGSVFFFNRDGRLTLGADGSGSTDAVTKQQLENASLGWGQTWQDVTGSRSDNTAYQNTTGKPICVSTFVSATRALEVSTDNSNWVEVSNTTTDGGTMQAIVPPNHYYRMNGSFDQWRELR